MRGTPCTGTRYRTVAMMVLAVMLLGVAGASTSRVTRADAGVNTWTGAAQNPCGADVQRMHSYAVGSGTELYVAAGYGGVMRSPDQGVDWFDVGSGLSGLWVRDVLRAQDGTLVAGTSTDGVYTLGLDGSTTWQPEVGGQTNGHDIGAVHILANGTWVAGLKSPPGGVLLSSNRGLGWTTPTEGIGHQVTALDSLGTTLLAGTVTHGLWTSSDGGDHWAQSTVGLPLDATVNAISMSPGVWWAATNTNLFSSTDEGASWTTSGSPGWSGAYTDVKTDSSGGTIAATYGIGVYYRNGAQWRWLPVGNPCWFTQAVAGDGASIYAGYRGLGVFAHRAPTSSDEPWNDVNSTMPLLSVKGLDFGPSGTAFAAGFTPMTGNGAGMMGSTDGGVTWAAVVDPFLGGYPVYQFARDDSGRLLAATGDGVMETTSGATWHRLNGLVLAWTVGSSPDGSVTVAGGTNNKILITHPGDPNWTLLPTAGLPDTYSRAVGVAPDGSILVGFDGVMQRLAAGASAWTTPTNSPSAIYSIVRGRGGRIFASGLGEGVWASSDNGASWAKTATSPGASAIPLSVTLDGTLFASVPGSGVHRSTNNGDTWELVGGSWTGWLTASASLDGSKVLAANSAGVHLYSLVAPEVTLSLEPSVPAALNGWYASSRTVHLDRDIDGETKWRIDGGAIETTKAASISFGAAEGSHAIAYWGQDPLVGSAVTTVTVRVDSSDPTGTMTIAKGAATTKTLKVTVNSAVADAISGMWRMRFSTNGGSSWGAWVPYAATASVTLPGWSGTKTVTAQYSDLAGHTVSRMDTIKFARPAPTMTRPALSKSYIRRSSKFTVTGYLSPNTGGKTTLYYYVKKSGKWTRHASKTLTNTTSGSRAKYSYRRSLPRRGSWYVRAKFTGNSAFLSKWSSKRYFTVH